MHNNVGNQRMWTRNGNHKMRTKNDDQKMKTRNGDSHNRKQKKERVNNGGVGVRVIGEIIREKI